MLAAQLELGDAERMGEHVIGVDLAEVLDAKGEHLTTLAWGDSVEVLEEGQKRVRIALGGFKVRRDASQIPVKREGTVAKDLARPRGGRPGENPKEIACIVVSHGDADHFSGLTEIRDSEEQSEEALADLHEEKELDLQLRSLQGSASRLCRLPSPLLKAVEPVVSVVSSGDEREHIHPRATLMSGLGKYGRDHCWSTPTAVRPA